jgi:zinc transport system ATP-binding protein
MLMECQNLSFGYDGHIVVSGLSFSVQTGDFLLIAGENGSGKSTLVKGLLRLLPAMEGKLKFSSDFKQSQTGFLSQQTAAKQDFPAGVMEIVLSGHLGKKLFLPFYFPSERHTAEEKRRVLLARSLCAAEKLLVLDEPFAGLDPLISAQLYRLLEKINRETGITVIMVSHDIAAADCANKVLHLQKQQLFFGSMEDYKKSEIGKKFLGDA